jgi:hypothetical protein
MERLTLEDAISHAKEVAEKNYRGADFESIDSVDDDIKANCIKMCRRTRTACGMVTYRKVYKKMGEMSPINWHNLEVRYINKHGKAGARRKKIISSNPEMLRKFKNAVDVMMVG